MHSTELPQIVKFHTDTSRTLWDASCLEWTFSSLDIGLLHLHNILGHIVTGLVHNFIYLQTDSIYLYCSCKFCCFSFFQDAEMFSVKLNWETNKLCAHSGKLYLLHNCPSKSYRDKLWEMNNSCRMTPSYLLQELTITAGTQLLHASYVFQTDLTLGQCTICVCKLASQCSSRHTSRIPLVWHLYLDSNFMLDKLSGCQQACNNSAE